MRQMRANRASAPERVKCTHVENDFSNASMRVNRTRPWNRGSTTFGRTLNTVFDHSEESKGKNGPAVLRRAARDGFMSCDFGEWRYHRYSRCMLLREGFWHISKYNGKVQFTPLVYRDAFTVARAKR
eukprot:IDg8708t1